MNGQKPIRHSKTGAVHPDDDPAWTDAELSIARYLREEAGFRVTSAGENPSGRLFDFILDMWTPADGKTLDYGGNSSTMRNEANNSVRNGGQARVLVFDLRGSGMDESEAIRGIHLINGLFGGNGSAGHKLDRIIVIGNRFYFEEAI